MQATCNAEPPTEDQVLGAASIIFWAIILVVVVKYQCICLMLNDHGEGDVSQARPQ